MKTEKKTFSVRSPLQKRLNFVPLNEIDIAIRPIFIFLHQKICLRVVSRKERSYFLFSKDIGEDNLFTNC